MVTAAMKLKDTCHTKGNKSWIFVGRTDAETPIPWPPDTKNWLIWKDPDAEKDWRQEEKGTTEDEMVGWHHQLNGHLVWVSSRSWWCTGRPGMLQYMKWQRLRHDSELNWATELNWTELLLGRKAMTNLHSILKSRDITLSTKVRLVKSMVFPAVMYGCESWTIKKVEHQKIDAFELWCWRRCWKDWCWSWNSNTLATWCKELTHLKRPWCWERLRAGGEGDDGGWDCWMASLTQWKWVWVNSGNWWWTGRPGVLQSMGSQRVGHDWVTELNWTLKLLQSHWPLGWFLDTSVTLLHQSLRSSACSAYFLVFTEVLPLVTQVLPSQGGIPWPSHVIYTSLPVRITLYPPPLLCFPSQPHYLTSYIFSLSYFLSASLL